MSEYIRSLGLTVGGTGGLTPSGTVDVGGIDWDAVGGIGITDPGFGIEESDFPDDLEATEVIAEEEPEPEPEPEEDETGLVHAEGGYASIQDLANMLYSNIFNLLTRILNDPGSYILVAELTNQMVIVGGVLHIEGVQTSIYNFLNKKLYSIDLLKSADIPDLARKIEYMFHVTNPLFVNVPIAHLMAEKLYSAADRIIIDDGLDGELPTDEAIADEGTVVIEDWPTGQHEIDLEESKLEEEDPWSTDGYNEGDNWSEDSDDWWIEEEKRRQEEERQAAASASGTKMILIGMAGIAALLLLKK